MHEGDLSKKAACLPDDWPRPVTFRSFQGRLESFTGLVVLPGEPMPFSEGYPVHDLAEHISCSAKHPYCLRQNLYSLP